MEEKSFQPTKRKLKRAREKGRVVSSQELASALLLLGALLLFAVFAKGLNRELKNLMITVFTSLDTYPTLRVFKPLFLILSGLILMAAGAHLIQRGWVWSWKKKKKQGNRYAPYRFVLSFLKLGMIAGIGALYLHFVSPTLFRQAEAKERALFSEVFHLSVFVIIGLLVLGLIDFFVQRSRFEKEMKMTKQERKEEQRETEGDSRIKREFRSKR